MKNLRWTILAALILAAPCAVQAQTAPAAPADASAVTNAPAPAVSTAGAGIPAEGSTDTAATSDTLVEETTETTRLGNGGGEPILMSLLGMSVAMGAFFLRRRATN